MTTEEIIHVYENSRLATEFFTEEAATAAYVEGLAALRAIQRLGKFGQLFLGHEGCPRGAVGRSALPLEEEVLSMSKIKDIDGGEWIPVNADALTESVDRYKILCAQQETRKTLKLEEWENHKPLTLEELQVMKYEWVYLKFPSEDKEIVRLEKMETADPEHGMKVTFWCGCNSGFVYELYTSDYGKIWLAYRHKPKEGSKC